MIEGQTRKKENSYRGYHAVETASQKELKSKTRLRRGGSPGSSASRAGQKRIQTLEPNRPRVRSVALATPCFRSNEPKPSPATNTGEKTGATTATAFPKPNFKVC